MPKRMLAIGLKWFMGQNIKKKTGSALVSSKEADTEVHAEKRKCMFITHEENAG